MTSQFMLPTTASAISGLRTPGEAFRHAPEKGIPAKFDDKAMRPLFVGGPQHAPLGGTRSGDDAERAALEAKELRPEEETDGAGIVNGGRVAVDSRLRYQAGNELGRLAAARPHERAGKARVGDDPAGDVEGHD